ncbi:hypothetical protein AAE478_003392 [Parahypoxylon ruwenzoriense]
MSPPPHPHFFTCTFCWHLSRGPPHILGRSSRLACESCYRSLIDLADNNRTSGDSSSSREITEVPACANCVVECEVDSVDRQTVVQRALRRVDKVDGGLTRKRWEKGHGQITRQAVGKIERVSTATPKIDQNPPPPSHPQWTQQSQSRAQTAHPHRLAGDGALSGSSGDGSDGADCAVPLDSTIYVSILDPLGEPAFKPSPTKPIPSWMQWLPSHQDDHQQSEAQPHSILDEHFPPHPIRSTNDSIDKPPTVCPMSPKQDPSYSVTPPHPAARHYRPSRTLEIGNLTESTIKALKGPSFVLDEPLKRPSSRVARSTSISPKTAMGETTTAQPNIAETLPARSRTPYFAPRQPSPLAVHGEGPGGGRDASWKARLRRPSSPLTDQVVAHIQRFVRRTPPAQSREFLNLYRPAAESSNPSITVPGRGRDKAVGDGRQAVQYLLNRDRDRDRASPPDGAGPGQIVTGRGEVLDARSVRKRSSLQNEVKKLFGAARGQGREGC